ncbi:MAG: type II toxin-antitoxin system HipA family toxin, partial [Pirellulaceae bacterium]
LLKAIGGECAGALEISPRCEPTLNAVPPRYQPVTDEQLTQWSVGTPQAFSNVTGQGEVRLSLAGVQDKLPVYIDDDQIFIPVAGSPSTHILKFASSFYSHLPENEAFMALLAKSVGLPVVDVHMRATPKARIAVIQRYDRVLQDGVYGRIHQEDFCQALGISPSSKYEKEGGPSLKQCAELIRRRAAFPLLDLNKLLQWAIFNWLTGNADAHGKNLSFLYSQSGAPSLAPFYDLVCTRNYKNLSRVLAMQIGGTTDPDLIGSQHLEVMAADLKVRPKLVLDVAEALLEKIAGALEGVSAKYLELYGDSPILERIPLVIRRQLRRARSQWS